MSTNGVTNETPLDKRRQASWTKPAPSAVTPPLVLFNSLTRDKNEFVPRDPSKIGFYICGPTVYDSSHMGHARAYVSFDIVRRVLADYFNLPIQYVMNVTDVDDKIIKRARQNHLYEQYTQATSSEAYDLNQGIADLVAASKNYKDKLDKEDDPDKKAMMHKLFLKMDESSRQLEASTTCEASRNAFAQLVKDGRDILMEWLDTTLGSSVSDQHIFTKHARQYEDEFHEDMRLLHVRPADVMTRVSEYVPEIVTFIQDIIDKGYAYHAKDKSVYFDVQKYAQSPDHHYAKLVPEAYTDPEAMKKGMREGEGDLTLSRLEQGVKRSDADFALWKSARPGEPKWSSPWGDGRPGWHIECSVMATAILGDRLDIHAGGFDLKFPHHDNEIAQSEARCGGNWVNYFLHAGTLRIEGLKMSKSLKNFITIREALQRYTARQIRLLFLLHNWADCLDYSVQTMERALSFEKVSNEFFLLAKHHLRELQKPVSADAFAKWTAAEHKLNDALSLARRNIDIGLRDSINTPAAMEAMRDIITAGNFYMKSNTTINGPLLNQVCSYMTRMLRTFGVIEESTEIGYPLALAGASGVNIEEHVQPVLNCLRDFRQAVRAHAQQTKDANILTECDKLRDYLLPELGVRLEDQPPPQPAIIKLADKEELMRERQQKIELEIAKQQAKADKMKKQQDLDAKKAKEMAIKPEDLFKSSPENKYSKFDEHGIPTHDATGEELSKKARKKLEKMHETHKERYDKYHANKGDD